MRWLTTRNLMTGGWLSVALALSTCSKPWALLLAAVMMSLEVLTYVWQEAL